MLKNSSKQSTKSINNSLVLNSILIILRSTTKDLLKMFVNQTKLNSTKLMMYHLLSNLKTVLMKNKHLKLKLNLFPTILLLKCFILWFLNKDSESNSKDWQKPISQIFSQEKEKADLKLTLKFIQEKSLKLLKPTNGISNFQIHKQLQK